MTQSKIRTNLVNLIQLLFQPETWTLSEPLTKSDYQPSDKPPIVCTLLPPSTQTFDQSTGWDDGTGDMVQSQYSIDIQLSFLFPNDMLFHQLPIGSITDAMGWLCVLISQHPSLLQIDKVTLRNLTNWQYGLLNQCLYDESNTPNGLVSVEPSWELSKVQETKIKDWLILISLQVRVKETCSISDYIPNNSIITPYPNPLAGIVTSPMPPFVLINNLIYSQHLPVPAGTLNTKSQKYPKQYTASDTPASGHNASFDVVIQQGIGMVPEPLPVSNITPLT